ncbi:hypothetical protein K492DRAFT_233430 [Lichtheimia hyalospora FSU 10163]|nr:hypothetical protein K492DRAFT_233430 [Lichtheimia hyalospora FSU 10163]
MYPRFARLAIGTSASQVGKKLALVSAAGAFAYSYATECKNDVLYFTPRNDGMVTQISVSRLAVIELPVIVMVFHMDDPSLSCTIRIPRKYPFYISCQNVTMMP